MSDDLISRSALLELYEENTKYHIPEQVVIQNIKDMPVAYDVNNVINRLKMNKETWSVPLGNGQYIDADFIKLNSALNIVKGGGTNDND